MALQTWALDNLQVLILAWEILQALNFRTPRTENSKGFRSSLDGSLNDLSLKLAMLAASHSGVFLVVDACNFSCLHLLLGVITIGISYVQPGNNILDQKVDLGLCKEPDPDRQRNRQTFWAVRSCPLGAITLARCLVLLPGLSESSWLTMIYSLLRF